MISLYTANTFNGQRVSIMLEETGLPYSVQKVDLVKGEQRQPGFIRLNPSTRIPVLVDYDKAYLEPLFFLADKALWYKSGLAATKYAGFQNEE